MLGAHMPWIWSYLCVCVREQFEPAPDQDHTVVAGKGKAGRGRKRSSKALVVDDTRVYSPGKAWQKATPPEKVRHVCQRQCRDDVR
jgi:hypothetical protein